MRFTLQETRLGLRNSTTRIPFRYGNTCLTRCPQAVVQATIEVEGRRHRGWSGDCLPPGWFDKRPGLSFRDQIDDMLAVIALAQKTFAEEAASPVSLFEAWLIAHERVQETGTSFSYQPLLLSFGTSLVERAIMDALCRAAGLGLSAAARANIFGVRAEDVHPELAGLQPADWLPESPSQAVYVRQTVGLGDALSPQDVPPDQRVADGFPQTIEEYVEQAAVRFFKVKLSGKLEWDLERLLRFVEVVEPRLGADYRITLDGNEQFHRAAGFDVLMDRIAEAPQLATLLKNTLAVEQPLPRDIALDPDHTRGIRNLSRRIPVIIDESDATLMSFKHAIDQGYRGVSSKNCKGAIKSILNAGLAWLHNDRGRRSEFVVSGEDLCSVGVIPTQSDLCLTATLGLWHVERNGHHYHPGLSYLPESQQREALAVHGDFYELRDGRVTPAIRDGKLNIASLHGPGFGFSVLPDIADWEPAETWRFESLGLDD
ncbi:MAG: hypothetical protein HYS13_20405 [Planctomycetia bacterium]|nr:hypothetical protein [Planctomycetia bacterium]